MKLIDNSPDAPESPLEALFESAGDLALHLDVLGKVTFVAGLTRVPALEPTLVAGGSFLDLFDPEHRPQVQEAFDQALQTRGRVSVQTPAKLAPSLHWMLCGYAAASRRGVMAVARTQQLGRQGELYDRLTGLPSRLLFQDRTEQAIELAKRQGAGFSMVLVNLRGFRKVNDGFGVKAGDSLLQEVARRLLTYLRASDTVARMGPDEFGVILPDLADDGAVLALTQQLQAALEAPYTLAGEDIHPSVALGFAMFPLQCSSYDELLSGAEAALKQAREFGGSRGVMFQPSGRGDAKESLTMEAALHQGVNNGELYLDYQPLVDIDGRVYGAEALMRWKRGGTVPVSPAQFIPIAEECGLIQLLGAWALKAASSAVAALNHDKGTELTISVNVSPRQFRGPQFLKSVTQALEFSGLPPRLLQLEITEGTLMTDPEAAASLLGRLSDLGVQVAVDDFGTGYSSLAYLKRFRLSSLKIDRSFVKDLPSAKDLAICRSVFSLSRELGLKSVAEGVETEEQWHILREAGCNAIQGYYFGKPQPLSQFSRLIAAVPLARAA